MIGIAMTFVVLILASVALGQAKALYASLSNSEICSLAFSWNTNIPSLCPN